MSQLAYKQGCGDEELLYECDNCPEGEGARVRGIAFIKTSYTFSDITNPNEWEQGILDKNIIVVPYTNGEWDGGTPKYKPGSGDVPQRYTGSDHKLTITDPNFKYANSLFYNNLASSQNYKIAWRSETKVFISSKACNAFFKSPIENDLNADVEYKGDVTFSQKPMPLPFDLPAGVFECMEVVPDP